MKFLRASQQIGLVIPIRQGLRSTGARPPATHSLRIGYYNSGSAHQRIRFARSVSRTPQTSVRPRVGSVASALPLYFSEAGVRSEWHLIRFRLP